ncbi:MAG: hypothetical protein H8F28_12375 [Fibrella sp.]|nr:hypothetical protein [Armatimonadota bacterium]
MSDKVEHFKEAAASTASATIHQLQDVAHGTVHTIQDVAVGTKREFSTLWQNADEREELIRTAAYCGGILVGVCILVALTGWMPLWLRLLVVVSTLGGLGWWMMKKISDSD